MKRVSMRTLGAFLLGLLFMTTACKKDQDILPGQNNNSGSFAPSFVGVRWQMVGFQLAQPVDFDGDGKLDSDLMGFIRPCDLDNTLIFERSGKMSGDNGKQACDDDPAPGSVKPASWTYDNATKMLRIVDGEDGSSMDWTVLEGTARSLKVQTKVSEDGRPMSAVLTWKAV